MNMNTRYIINITLGYFKCQVFFAPSSIICISCFVSPCWSYLIVCVGYSFIGFKGLPLDSLWTLVSFGHTSTRDDDWTQSVPCLTARARPHPFGCFMSAFLTEKHRGAFALRHPFPSAKTGLPPFRDRPVSHFIQVPL